jgi:hypothetical protein
VVTVVLVAGSLPAAPVQGQAVTPVVTLGAAQPVLGPSKDCTGPIKPLLEPGRIGVGVDSALATPILVQINYTGTLRHGIDFNAPTTLAIASGSKGRDIDVASLVEGTVIATVEPGSGYALGSPATVTLTFKASHLVTGDCARSTIRRTTHVGGTPAPTGGGIYRPGSYEGKSSEVIGELPPGLTLDDSWDIFSGHATTPGTFTYSILQGLYGVFYDRTDIVVTVLANPSTAPPATLPHPTPTAPAAQPVSTQAQFTG